VKRDAPALEHALDSVALIHDIRTVLSSATEGRTEWSQEVGSLVDRIDKILKNTPDAYVPAE
jgi:uncharacterized NAD(P)/FAD-binding protein YdhS